MPLLSLGQKEKSKDIFSNIGLSIIAILLLFVFAEIIIRIAILYKNKVSFEKVINSLPKVEQGSKVGFGDMIQPNPNPKIIYELRPNLRVYCNNYFTRTNDRGFRSSKNYVLEKKYNTVRIIGLGDSYMFGQGVGQDKDIMSVLESKLNKRFPQKKWEVINTAVPGYDTVIEVETLKEKMLAYSPDIVIIEFIGNDFQLPNFIYNTSSWIDLNRSFFLDFLIKRYVLLKSNSFKLIGAPANPRLGWGFEDDPSAVPEQYRDMVGWSSYVTAMTELRELKEQHGFDVVSFLTLGFKDERVFNLSRQLQFYTTYNDAYDLGDPSLLVSKNDIHPSKLGHRMNAEKLLNFMIDAGIIKKYLNNED